MKKLMIGLVGVVLLVAAVTTGDSLLERNRQAAERRALRDALDQARTLADSCTVALAAEQRAFLRFDEKVDSLRAAVDGYEDPAKGGVPEEVYPEYLRTFEAYNHAVEVWKDEADSLRIHESLCRDLVEDHNEVADSLQRFYETLRDAAG